jgi:hypothetical protein
MSRTIKTNSGSEFITNISSEKLIGILCKEVGAKHYSDLVGPAMAYDMTEEEANDSAYRLTILLESRKYFRFFEKNKHFFIKDAPINIFEDFVEDLINKLKQSKGYECL